jgi:cell division protein FtsQ
MAAVVRGGASRAGKPRPESRAAYAQPSSRPRAAKGAKNARGVYAPGKLNAASAVGLPPRMAVIGASIVLGLGLIAALVTGDRPQRVGAAMQAGYADALGAVGFKLNKVHVDGVPDYAKLDILKATGLYKHAPILGVNLEQMRADVQQVGWAKEVKVVRLLPDTVVIVVTPRPTLAVWQNNGRLQVIDDEGRVIREAHPAQFPELPLVVGAGANEAAGVIMPVLKTRPQLLDRTEALVRVDGRRWDLRLKDGSLIQLPAVGEDSALIQLDQLNQRSRVLDLGFERIDLRDADMIAVRPRVTTPAAVMAPPAAEG